jgi:hypothetical protein
MVYRPFRQYSWVVSKSKRKSASDLELEGALAKQKEDFRLTAKARLGEQCKWLAITTITIKASTFTTSTHKQASRLIAWRLFVSPALPDSCSADAIQLVQDLSGQRARFC